MCLNLQKTSGLTYIKFALLKIVLHFRDILLQCLVNYNQPCSCSQFRLEMKTEQQKQQIKSRRLLVSTKGEVGDRKQESDRQEKSTHDDKAHTVSDTVCTVFLQRALSISQSVAVVQLPARGQYSNAGYHWLCLDPHMYSSLDI